MGKGPALAGIATAALLIAGCAEQDSQPPTSTESAGPTPRSTHAPPSSSVLADDEDDIAQAQRPLHLGDGKRILL